MYCGSLCVIYFYFKPCYGRVNYPTVNNQSYIGTIHPELAIQLAQWISPKFAIQVSKWIINLFTDGKVEITTKLITENKLKDTYVQKQKREECSEKCVIYILATIDHLKNMRS